MDDDQLLEVISKLIEISNIMKEQCSNNNIKFIDVSDSDILNKLYIFNNVL